MTRRTHALPILAGFGLAACLFNASHAAHAQATLVTGKKITVPALGAQQNVGSLPMNMILTPNGRYAISSDMGFRQSLWCIDTHTGQGVSHLDFPRQQVGTSSGGAPILNSNGLYYGLAFAPAAGNDGSLTLYAAQGNLNSIAVLRLTPSGMLSQTGTLAMKPGDFAAGLAVGGTGLLYVAVNQNYTNSFSDATTPSSLAVLDPATGAELGRYAFGVPASAANPAGTTPNYLLAVAVTTVGGVPKAYVTSQRDGAVYALNVSSPAAITRAATIALPLANPTGAPSPTGTPPAHPIGLLLSPNGATLYVANAHTDTVSVISTSTDTITGTVNLRPSGAKDLAGVTPTGLALSNDAFNPGLFVSLGDMNAVAVIDPATLAVKGYIPTGWYPTAVAIAPGKKLLVANAKGVKTRYPNPGYNYANGSGDPFYGLNLTEGTVATLPVPTPTVLRAQTQQVLANNGITDTTSAPDNPLASIGLGAGKITHVIYIIKENRTYDQVLGDLPQGNGAPGLVLFGQKVTPNQHALASRFVLLDNFYDCGEASGDGWPWSTQGIANEAVIKDLPYNYSGRGRNYDYEGSNNNYPTGGFPASDPYGAPLVSPGTPFAKGAPAIPDVSEAPAGHIWDLAGQAGLIYRNYGYFTSFGQTVKNMDGTTSTVLPFNYPGSKGLQPVGHDLGGKSDFDFLGYNQNFPDSDAPQNVYKSTGNANALFAMTQFGHYNQTSRFAEFKREFGEMLAAGTTAQPDKAVPNLIMLKYSNDHTQGLRIGNHIHSPKSGAADNDYAVGQTVELLSSNPAVWQHTAIFVIEDDAQNGPDHVDSHRSTCYVISPYIKQNSVDHTFYNTDSVLKTMEQLMGLPPMSQYDATANAILDFDTIPSNGLPYTAVQPDAAIIADLNPSTLSALKPGTVAYHLARLSQKMNFSQEDMAPADLLNQIIWKSVKGMNSPMPAPRHRIVAVRPAAAAGRTHAAHAPRAADND